MTFAERLAVALESAPKGSVVVACEPCGEVMVTLSRWEAYDLTIVHLHHRRGSWWTGRSA